LECKIYFAIGVQNLFCNWSAKFILQLECLLFCERNACYFAENGVQGDNHMNATTFNEIIKSTETLTLDEQLRLAAYLIEKIHQTSAWQIAISQVSGKKAQARQEFATPPANRWRAFFESREQPTEDFMSERVDLPPQPYKLRNDRVQNVGWVTCFC